MIFYGETLLNLFLSFFFILSSSLFHKEFAGAYNKSSKIKCQNHSAKADHRYVGQKRSNFNNARMLQNSKKIVFGKRFTLLRY